jgi:sugar (pentulose or hexulose) kinase
MADIFNTRVRVFEASDSAALGAAIRAAKSYYDSINQINDWNGIITKFIDFQRSVVIQPREMYKELYDNMLELYKKCENYILKKGEDPEKLRLKFIKKYF